MRIKVAQLAVAAARERRRMFATALGNDVDAVSSIGLRAIHGAGNPIR